MNKQKKVIIGSVLVIVLLVGGLFGYGEWNRRKGKKPMLMQENVHRKISM